MKELHQIPVLQFPAWCAAAFMQYELSKSQKYPGYYKMQTAWLHYRIMSDGHRLSDILSLKLFPVVRLEHQRHYDHFSFRLLMRSQRLVCAFQLTFSKTSGCATPEYLCMRLSRLCVCVYMCYLPAKLGKNSWGEIGGVAATRVLLLTPVLLLIVHRLNNTKNKC